MSDAQKLSYLRPYLVFVGLACLSLLPISKFWPSGFAWHAEDTRSYYFEMICAVYFVLGIFLIIAARNPLDHRSLIWFTMWSSLAHGLLMLAQSFNDYPHHVGHLVGDVPFLLIGAAVLAWLMPRKRSLPTDFGGQAR